MFSRPLTVLLLFATTGHALAEEASCRGLLQHEGAINGVGECMFTSGSPLADRILSVCKGDDVCRVRGTVYGQFKIIDSVRTVRVMPRDTEQAAKPEIQRTAEKSD